ncbi:uncharacterized protein [Venturia canescens]|uniref:uncharacterized protein n=1 Tax=Venturia canescens TaxID=32260 RepID=UPI001C9C4E78|nr:uncharacterized protein LOC122414376 [Venturia canescens]
MENLSDMYYLIRFIVGRIFVYLRDIILHELSWFPDENGDIDASEAKARGHPFSRKAVADFVAFFTICAVFGSFFVFSTKCNKEEQSAYDPPRPVSAESEGEPLELLEDDEYTICNTPVGSSHQNAWGDATMGELDVERPLSRQKFGGRSRVPFLSKKRNGKPSMIELRGTHSQHSQSTQTNERLLQRVTNKRDWLIRRTRSGHIYGKYPM